MCVNFFQVPGQQIRLSPKRYRRYRCCFFGLGGFWWPVPWRIWGSRGQRCIWVYLIKILLLVKAYSCIVVVIHISNVIKDLIDFEGLECMNILGWRLRFLVDTWWKCGEESTCMAGNCSVLVWKSKETKGATNSRCQRVTSEFYTLDISRHPFSRSFPNEHGWKTQGSLKIA